MKPWVLIDTSFIAHRARYALQGMELEDFPTGIIYGFFEQIRTFCLDERIQSNRTVFLFDSRKSYRKRFFPAYKRRDLKWDEEEKKRLDIMYDVVRLLRTEILPGTGAQVHRQTGCESDDLIAKAARQLTDSCHRGVMVTADGDLYQCISNVVHWYDPYKKVYHTPESFERAKGLDPACWGLVKVLAGCNGDGVPGVPKVGEKTAVDFLLKRLPPHYKRAEAIESPEGRAIIERNRQLVLLPHKKTRAFELKEPNWNLEAFNHYCERYGLLSFLKGSRRDGWEAFFTGRKIQTRKRGQLR